MRRKGDTPRLEGSADPRLDRVELLANSRGKTDVVHVVHPAGDDPLQHALLIADVAESAINPRRDGDRVELLKDRAFATVVVPSDLETALEHCEGLIGLLMRKAFWTRSKP